MQVKRIFVDGTVDHLKLLRGPEIGAPQNFTQRFIDKGIVEGWLSFDGGEMVVKSKPKNLKFKVLAAPGQFEDASEPAGYRVDNFYATERIG